MRNQGISKISILIIHVQFTFTLATTTSFSIGFDQVEEEDD